MHEHLQPKKSSWTPSTAHNKPKHSSKLGHFSIPPQPQQESSHPQEIKEYSRDSADRLAANVMRGLQAREQEQTPQQLAQANTPQQIWQRAQSIKPVIQQQIDQRLQMGKMVQRADQIERNQASFDLENRLNESKQGNHFLPSPPFSPNNYSLTSRLFRSSPLTRTHPPGTSENPPSHRQTLIAQTDTIQVPRQQAGTVESSLNYAAEQLGLEINDGVCTLGNRAYLLQANELDPRTQTRTVQVSYGLCGDTQEDIQQQTEYFEQSAQITNNNDPETLAELNAALHHYAQQYGGKLEDTPLWRDLSTIYGQVTQQNASGELTQAILYTLAERHLINQTQLQERIRRRRASRSDVNALNQDIAPLNAQVALNLEQDVTYHQLFQEIIADIAQSERGSEKIQNIENKINEIAARFQYTQGESIDTNAIRHAVLVYWDSQAQQAVGGTPEQQPILEQSFQNLPADNPNPHKGTQRNIRERALNIFEAVTNHRNPRTEAEQRFYRALRNSVMLSYYPDITNTLEYAAIKDQIEQLNPPVQETLNAVGNLDSIPTEDYAQVLEMGRQLEQLTPPELQVYQNAIRELDWNLEQLETSIQAYRQTRDRLQSSAENSLDIESLLAVDNTTEDDKPNGWQILKDLIASSLGSVRYAPEVLGELWQEIKAQWPLFIGSLVALIAAEKLVIALAAAPEPTFLTKALAVALQGLIVAVYGVSFTVTLTAGLGWIETWWDTAVAANGDPAEIEEASKAFLRAIGNLLLAVLSFQGLRRNISPERWAALQAMLQRVKRNNPNLRFPDDRPTLTLVPDPENPNRYIFLPDEPPPASPNPPTHLLPPERRSPINLPRSTPPPRPTPGTRLGTPGSSGGGITTQPPQVPQSPTHTTPNLPSVPEETPFPPPAPQPTTPFPAPFTPPAPARELDLTRPPIESEPVHGIDLTPGTPETIAPPSATEPLPAIPSNLEPLATRLASALGLSLSATELQQASQGTFLTEVEIDSLVRQATNWQEVLGNYLAYPDLLRQIIRYREGVIFETVTTVVNNNPEFQELDIYLVDEQGVVLGRLTDMVAAGSTDLTSDYDVTFSAGAGRENLEVLAVAAFNQLFRSNWGRESGIVFDTNVYTSGHMRPDAFQGDGAKLNLVNKLVNKLEDIEDKGNLPTAEQRREINGLVARVNGLQDVTITDTLPQLEVSNFFKFEAMLDTLQVSLEDKVRKQYNSSKEKLLNCDKSFLTPPKLIWR
jgi:hypothetical protein